MKRARYDGPHEAVEVWPNGYTGLSVIVEHGHLLPTEDANGDPVPAAFRDSLLEQSDIWSEVSQSPKRKPAAQVAESTTGTEKGEE